MLGKRSNRRPQQVGQYYLMEKIAQGGMAEIFKGISYDVSGIKKTVCIKKILPHISASEEFIGTLIDEAKIAVKLVHGNIAQTYDLGKVGDDYFMVMEFVDGKSLSQINKRCASLGELLPTEHLVYFISEALNGLDYIHRRTDEHGVPLHIVHRDMSPQNIMVSYSGTVKIIDFGIAKIGFKVGSTDSGVLKGKFAYMSPEQAYGDTIDNRSDIYSVGIILHEMLTGKRLFKAADSRETIRNVRKAEVVPPSTILSGIPDDLDRITLKALSKDRRRRYSHASEMRDDLIKFLHMNYPEFGPSHSAEFIQALFDDEFGKPRKDDADAKTPYLIIDRSNSALANDSQFETTGAIRVPVNLEEYMVEGERPNEDTGEDESSEAKKILPELDDKDEKTSRKFSSLWSIISAIKYQLVVLLLASIVIAGSIYHRSKTATEKTPHMASGRVMVATIPTDAEVYLDGSFKGKGSPVSIPNVPAGKDIKLEVKRDGYFSHERVITLASDGFESLSISLSPAVKPTATIEITTEPAGATVFIDDRETSHRTPARIEKISPDKEISVGLFLKDHQFWSRKISLNAGETKSFDVQMAKAMGSVSITSIPPEALVMIDHVPAGQTPMVKGELDPGQVHTVDVWLQGYETATKEFRVLSGKELSLRFVLTKLPTEAEMEAATRGSDTQPKEKKDGEKRDKEEVMEDKD
ncbi:MAG TPA: serine/threonine-protein kinase [bacterium]|mgnify:FL=1|nr:serine/threonine-protein kinase [bacterium]